MAGNCLLDQKSILKDILWFQSHLNHANKFPLLKLFLCEVLTNETREELSCCGMRVLKMALWEFSAGAHSQVRQIHTGDNTRTCHRRLEIKRE
jgi:hypothetical protein